ncbi:Biotrophy-associated secreted protein [Dirofilaria immitis]
MVFETPETEFRNRIGSRDEKVIVREGSISNDSKIRSALTSALAKKNGEKYNFFEDEQVRKTGSIFERRKDMQYVKEALPRARLNGFHIKIDGR